MGIGLLQGVTAQNIDFDFPGRNTSEVTEPNYIPWAVGRVESESKTFDNGMTLTVAGGDNASAVASTWSKQTIQGGFKLVGDGVIACNLEDGNYIKISEGATSIILTIEGMSPGPHSLIGYHCATDKNLTLPPIQVSVDGVVNQTNVKYATNTDNLKMSDVGRSYVEFNVTEGQPVVIKFMTVPEEGKSYGMTSITLNALEFDVNPYGIMDEIPENYDYHFAADDGAVTFQWQPADIAVSHRLVYGTDSTTVADAIGYQYEGKDATFTAGGFSPLNRYWWRVDEVDADGHVHKGKVMTFQTRRNAFPGAEGYGRYAIGGRGGVVYHVTSLADDGSEGTLRYGLKEVKGPRTIVFDVAGVISLKSRLSISDKFVTVAGQTAPGNGIMLRTSAFGMQSDGITRFMRMRLGHKKLINGVIPGGKNSETYGSEEGTTEETTLGGLDGMGMAGNDHAIMDHCSISWTIDEAFSSRNAKHMTLQYTLISEALNRAGHPNYDAGSTHGFAATIGGGEMGAKGSSFHHNLLAHNAGRNWSISGGLDGKGYYDGHHDVFNNVVYNWDGRTTDGGTHEMNFVNNYYKVGPANGTKILLNAQIEGTGKGTQSYYVKGNIRENLDGTKTQDKLNTTYKYSLSGGQVLDWQVFVDEPFFPSYATIETAEAAFKNVLSDVGCNMPLLDKHDERMVSETLNGTYVAKGSRTGKKGLIDSEEDSGCEGFDLDKLNIVEVTREADWDTDQDGIPNWFETITGTDPNQANNNDDRDGDYYTDLEEYLNWIAEPNFIVKTGEKKSFDLKPYFAGYKAINATAEGASIEGTTLTFNASEGGLFKVNVTVTEDGISLTRPFHFAVQGENTGIVDVKNTDQQVDSPVYNLSGQRVSIPRKGIFIKDGKKIIVK